MSKFKKYLLFLFFAIWLNAVRCSNPSTTRLPETKDSPTIKRYKALGTYNFGANCFANAANKLLWSMPNIRKIIQSKLIQEKGESSDHFNLREKVREALAHLINGFFSKLNCLADCSAYSPRFKNELNNLFQAYDRYRNRDIPADKDKPKSFFADQQDPEEYLTTLLTILNYVENFEPEFLRRVDFNSETDLTRENYPDPLYNQSVLAPIILFNVPKDSNSEKADSKILSMQTLIDSYNLYGTPLKTKRRMIFFKNERYPEATIIQLIRYTSEKENEVQTPAKTNEVQTPAKTNEVQTPIEISDIQLEVYDQNVTVDQLENHPSLKKLKMEPIAVVVHAGESIHGGHYFAYTKTNDRWILHDDSAITVFEPPALQLTDLPEGDKNIIRRNAYLLLYKLKK